MHKIISGAVNRKTICWWPSWEASPLPSTGQDGGYVAALPELWHICVFIEAGGMELGKLGGGVGVNACAWLCFSVCVWRGGGVIERPSCCVWGSGKSFGGGREGGRAKRRREKVRQREKGGSCRSGCIYRSVVKRSHLRGMRLFLHHDRRGACLKSKRQLWTWEGDSQTRLFLLKTDRAGGGEGSEWVLSDFICSLFKVCFTCPCAAPPTSNTGAAF